jgi:hypothetical protein
MKIALALFVILILSGCGLMPYQYNNSLSPSENAHYRQKHIENQQRAGQALMQYSDQLKRQEQKN